MSDSIARETLREIKPLDADELVGLAVRRVIDAGLPALPAVEQDGRFAGIFGEREFMAALFPGYVGELASAAMVRRSVDETIERRGQCREEPIRRYLTTDHVLVEDDYSDTQLAELFLHHRVLIVPIATRGRVHAVVTRHDFFRALAARLGGAQGGESTPLRTFTRQWPGQGPTRRIVLHASAAHALGSWPESSMESSPGASSLVSGSPRMRSITASRRDGCTSWAAASTQSAGRR